MGPAPRSIRGLRDCGAIPFRTRRSIYRPLIAGAAFGAAAIGTVAWSASMDGAMPMPGGWTMSMAWMRMRGSWPLSWAAFVAMWTLMMIAMMLPSLAPVMLRHRRPVRVAFAYFGVWAAAGALIHPIGASCAYVIMSSRAIAWCVPVLGGVLVVLAGVAQLMRWKMRELDRCRDRSCCAPGRRAGPRQAWRDGVGLGAHCVRCCAPLIAILCVAGVMDPLAMLAVGAAITIERLARWPHRTARVIGACAIAFGVIAIVRALRGA